jgi:uncharacterized membrane protein YkoI
VKKRRRCRLSTCLTGAWRRASPLALILLTLAAAAHADVGLDRAATPGEPLVRTGKALEQDALRRELDRFRAAPISLRRALAIAQDLHGGSRVVDIGFDGEHQIPVYQVKTHRGDILWQNAIDAHTGNTVGTEVVSSIDGLGKPDRELLVRLRAVRQELLDAVVVAERNISGMAISAGIMMERGRLQFAVVCVSGSDLKQVLLEPPGTGSHRRR